LGVIKIAGRPEPKMKTSQIRYFLTLCEDLNFTKAAVPSGRGCDVAIVSKRRIVRDAKGAVDDRPSPYWIVAI
jgi:hypothetical protein